MSEKTVKQPKLDLRTREEKEFDERTPIQRLLRASEKFASVFWAFFALAMILLGSLSISLGNKTAIASGITAVQTEKLTGVAQYVLGLNFEAMGISLFALGLVILLAIHVSGNFNKIDYRFKKIEEYYAGENKK